MCDRERHRECERERQREREREKDRERERLLPAGNKWTESLSGHKKIPTPWDHHRALGIGLL